MSAQVKHEALNRNPALALRVPIRFGIGFCGVGFWCSNPSVATLHPNPKNPGDETPNRPKDLKAP